MLLPDYFLVAKLRAWRRTMTGAVALPWWAVGIYSLRGVTFYECPPLTSMQSIPLNIAHPSPQLGCRKPTNFRFPLFLY